VVTVPLALTALVPSKVIVPTPRKVPVALPAAEIVRPLRVSEYTPIRLDAAQLPPPMVCANTGAVSKPRENKIAVRAFIILCSS
jgi:hypothetical protein